MEVCDVCEKELGDHFRNVSIYRAHLLRRGVNKGRLGSSVASEYGKFELVTVKVCRRHLRGFFTQRLIPGIMAFIVILIPIASLLYLLQIWGSQIALMLLIAAILTLIPVYFLVRRISYDAYIASFMTLQPKNRVAKVEYFGQAKYRRIMKNLARLDAMVDGRDQK